MFTVNCLYTTFDVVMTMVLLYGFFITDLVFTFVNLNNLKKIFPKTYFRYEKNYIINYLMRKFSFKNTVIIYSVVGVVLFGLVSWYLVQPSLLIGVFITMVMFIHIPNFFEIKKRLEKKCRKVMSS